MSAAVGTVAEDSSSEDEDLQKFKEAAWSFGTCGNNGTHSINTADAERKPSRRVAVSKHEHDGNELQTTPEFRMHVANKLGAILDRSIAVISAETPKPSACIAKCEDEEGFKLFTTSVPGDFTIEPPPTSAPVRCRSSLISSDSDSEMDERLREAAVSVTDLLASALPLAVTTPLPTPAIIKKKKRKKQKDRCQKEENAERVESNTSLAPNKKKRKTTQGDCGEDSAQPLANAETEKEQKRPEDGCLPPKAKKKKKKKKRKSTDQTVEGMK